MGCLCRYRSSWRCCSGATSTRTVGRAATWPSPQRSGICRKPSAIIWRCATCCGLLTTGRWWSSGSWWRTGGGRPPGPTWGSVWGWWAVSSMKYAIKYRHSFRTAVPISIIAPYGSKTATIFSKMLSVFRSICIFLKWIPNILSRCTGLMKNAKT